MARTIRFLGRFWPFFVVIVTFLIPEAVVWYTSDDGSCLRSVVSNTIRADLPSYIGCQNRYIWASAGLIKVLSYGFGLTFFAYGLWKLFDELKDNIEQKISLLAIETEKEMRSASSEVKGLALHIVNRGDFEYIGPALEAGERITLRFKDAKRIRNVHIPYGTDMYRPLVEARRVKAIKEFLSRPGTSFIEIIGREAYLKYGSEYVACFAEHMSSSRMEIRVTNQVFPFMNFCLLDFERESGRIEHELWFGWGGYSTLPAGDVYSTRSKPATDMFSEMFRTVYSISSTPSGQDSLIRKLTDYSGFWIDVGFNGKQMERCALLKFGFEGGPFEKRAERRLCLRGLAFDIKDGRPSALVRRFKSLSLSIRRDKVYVSHEASVVQNGVERETSLGHSVYDFSNMDLDYMTAEIYSPGHNDSQFYIRTMSCKLDDAAQRKLSHLWPLDDTRYPSNVPEIRDVVSAQLGKLISNSQTLNSAAN